MDSATIEKNGIEVLDKELGKIDKIKNKKDVEEEIAYLHSYGISPGFQLYGAADDRNSSMVITQLYQGGLGMPDRDYYLSDNDRFVKIRQKYINASRHSGSVPLMACSAMTRAGSDSVMAC